MLNIVLSICIIALVFFVLFPLGLVFCSYVEPWSWRDIVSLLLCIYIYDRNDKTHLTNVEVKMDQT